MPNGPLTNTTHIHPTAIIDKDVTIGSNVNIGAYCVVEGDVTLLDNVTLKHHVSISADKGSSISIGCNSQLHAFVSLSGSVVFGSKCIAKSHGYYTGNLKIGSGNIFGAHVSIGDINQDKKHTGPVLETIIGDDNMFFEGVVVHCGTSGDRKQTRIGSRCHIMDGAHIAHDVLLGNDVVVGNDVNFGGHVVVEDFAWVAAGSGIHQFCHIGTQSFIAGYTRVVLDVAPYTLCFDGLGGLNVTGLKRQGFDKKILRKLNKTYKSLFGENNEERPTIFAERLQGLISEQDSEPESSDVIHLMKFIQESTTNPKRRGCYTKPINRKQG